MDPLSILLGIGSKVIDKLFPDETTRDAAKLELLKMQQSGELAQLAAETDLAKAQIGVNAEDAKSGSLLVSGWRPAIGWVCGAACAWNWIGLPVTKIALAMWGHSIDLSPADMSEMMPILMGMLGLGSLRTFEKVKGVSSK